MSHDDKKTQIARVHCRYSGCLRYELFKCEESYTGLLSSSNCKSALLSVSNSISVYV